MELRIKNEWADVKMSCPVDGQVKTLRFLDKELYIHWYNRGVKFPFDVINEEISEPIIDEAIDEIKKTEE